MWWLTRDWRRARSLTRLECCLLLEAWVYLAVAGACVRLLPFRLTMRLFRLRPAAMPVGYPAQALPAVARPPVWAVRIITARIPRAGNCLAQALAGSAMLRRRGVGTTIELGAAINAGTRDGMTAHAWLRYGGTALTGGNGSRNFIPVAALAVRGDNTLTRCPGEW